MVNIDCEERITRLIRPTKICPELGPRPAIIQAGAGSVADRTLTYRELEDLIGMCARTFSGAGVVSQDVVLLCSPNTPELVAAILACWRIGAVAMPVDYRLTEGEVDNTAVKVSARLIYSPRPIDSKLPTINSSNWSANTSVPEVVTEAAAASPALVILTSGTTGTPKGAVHDLASLTQNLEELGRIIGLHKEQRIMLPLPVSHIVGMEVLLASIFFGATVVFSDFSTEFWSTAHRLTANIIVGVPTIYGALLHLKPPSAEVLNQIELLLCGGAPLPLSLAQSFERTYGKRICQGYGTTESKIVTVNLNGPLDSVGKPIPSAKVEIVDDLHNVLPEGKTGQIRISGPSLMIGYFNQAEATAAVVHHEGYYTGDIGHVKDGHLFISGRSTEMIIMAGHKIFPSEVETVIGQHPMVSEVAVLGTSHSRLGQIVRAMVVLTDGEESRRLAGQAADREKEKKALSLQFRNYCRQHLKRELRPMSWSFYPSTMSLPRTRTGKIDKVELSKLSE